MGRVSWVLRVIKPVILGFVFAYLIEPVVVFLSRNFIKANYLKMKRQRTWAAVISVVLLFIALPA